MEATPSRSQPCCCPQSSPSMTYSLHFFLLSPLEARLHHQSSETFLCSQKPGCPRGTLLLLEFSQQPLFPVAKQVIPCSPSPLCLLTLLCFTPTYFLSSVGLLPTISPSPENLTHNTVLSLKFQFLPSSLLPLWTTSMSYPGTWLLNSLNFCLKLPHALPTTATRARPPSGTFPFRQHRLTTPLPPRSPLLHLASHFFTRLLFFNIDIFYKLNPLPETTSHFSTHFPLYVVHMAHHSNTSEQQQTIPDASFPSSSVPFFYFTIKSHC